jgi:alkylated DNA repair dioxygenase AlkB
MYEIKSEVMFTADSEFWGGQTSAVFWENLRREVAGYFSDGAERCMTPYGYPVPRDQRFLSADGSKTYLYNTSARAVPRKRWGPLVGKLAKYFSVHFNTKFDLVLANRYIGQNDSVDWHSDSEKMIDDTVPIVSISLGVPRRFLMKPVGAKGRVKFSVDRFLTQGDVVVMPPGSQTHFQHCVPKQTERDRKKIEEQYGNEARYENTRYNLTLRKYKEP